MSKTKGGGNEGGVRGKVAETLPLPCGDARCPFTVPANWSGSGTAGDGNLDPSLSSASPTSLSLASVATAADEEDETAARSEMKEAAKAARASAARRAREASYLSSSAKWVERACRAASVSSRVL